MDFPPLDDAGWDRLLQAVLDEDDSRDAPAADLVESAEGTDATAVGADDEVEQTIVLDAYA